MEDSDLVFYEENGETKSVGYKINNSLINRMPAIVMSGGGRKKGKVEKIYAVPAGLYLLCEKHKQSTTNRKQKGGAVGGEVIGDNLYERLLALAAPHHKKKKAGHKTRKKRRTSKRRTRKTPHT